MFEIIPERNKFVIDRLKARFGDSIDDDEVLVDMLCVTVRKEVIADVLSFLYNDTELNYNFLTTLCGMHYPQRDQLGVVYHLHSFVNNHRIRIKTSTDINNPVLPTATTIWPSANWMERETFDFYGILFDGHPNLVRILNMEEMTAFPMRKEFPLEDQGRDDKDDSMFGR